MREKFEDRKLKGAIRVACKYDDGTVRYWDTTKEDVVSHILYVVKEYGKEGYILTLRQLHYQLVSNNWIVNHDTAYKKLGTILDDCRYAGLIDWYAFEDRGRVPYQEYSVSGVKEALDDTLAQYKRDRQEGQDNVVELWTEKDALSGILKRTTRKYHVRLVVNKGYTSSSAIYMAYERVMDAIESGKKFKVLYFGDHDPSGLDMVRDIKERIEIMLSRGSRLSNYEPFNDWWDKTEYNIHDVAEKFDDYNVTKLLSDEHYDNESIIELFEEYRCRWWLQETGVFEVKHIGLTMEQIKDYNLPPNPTKLTDTRSDKYVRKFGKTSWEVDALSPQILTDLVEEHIKDNIDMDIFQAMLEQEEVDKDRLRDILLGA